MIKLKIFPFVYFILMTAYSFSQSLGNYPSPSVSVGGNISITPSAVPSNTTRISVSASTKFTGLLTAKASSGIVTITDAKPVGSYTITVKAFSSSGGSSTKTFTLTVNKPGCSQGNFSGNSQIAAGPNQNNIALGDFNNDGKQDMAMAHEGFNTLSIRMGDGHGGFSGNTEIAVSSHPYSLAIGDFNNDGKQDIANTNQGNDRVTVLLGNGLGGFTLNQTISVDVGPVAIAIGDFNSDGNQDIVTANLNASNVSILMGSASGSFSSRTDFSVAAYPASVAIGDFNADGKQDLATSSGGNSTISIRLGNGLGSFSGTTEVPVGQNPYCVTIGDFNHDGNQDLASANYLANSISIRLGNGFGGFSGNTEIPVGYNPYNIAVGNFNGDANEDLVTANYFGNTVSVRMGDGLGGFSGTTEIPAGSYPICVVVGDFNNDGLQELAVANYIDQTVSIRMGVPGVPPAVLSFSNGPFCEGLDLQLNASGGALYSWTGPNGFISTDQNPIIYGSSVNNSGLYTAVVTSATNCTATTSTSVNVNTLPVVSIALPNDTICDFDPIVALSGSPIGGSFYGTGIQGNEFNPLVSGVGAFPVTYVYTNAYGCTDSSSDKMHVLLCTGIAENNAHWDFSIYPNPIRESFTMDLSNVNGTFRTELITPEGKVIKSWNAEGNEKQTFSAEGIAAGIYVLKLFSNKHSAIVRFVKQ